MKRILTLVLAVVILLSLTVTAYAESGGNTTLRTRVYQNPPTWNLSIPASVNIPYQQTTTSIGTIAVNYVNNPDNARGYIDVKLEYDSMRNIDYNYLVMPLSIYGEFTRNDYNGDISYRNLWHSGQTYNYLLRPDDPEPVFEHAADFRYGGTEYHPVNLTAEITREAWDCASPGTYETSLIFTSTLTYTADPS